LASPGFCSVGRDRGQWVVRCISHVRRVFLAKSQRFDANDGNACRCRNHLEGHWHYLHNAKALGEKHFPRGLDNGSPCVATLLGSLSLSPGPCTVLVVLMASLASSCKLYVHLWFAL
jgi:hypothetical protein